MAKTDLTGRSLPKVPPKFRRGTLVVPDAAQDVLQVSAAF
ncbi:hypothetical protein THTE_3977 [Thermogutta terrifontis]|uniref:Uncharacterized protein n=1 Tax=Thermogutta terrifontis TaxID=1331910 RepID=A0A286RKV7_9BACT|nr:hypothetical protein THTE_3977 [Thermogutta terrifontis]